MALERVGLLFFIAAAVGCLSSLSVAQQAGCSNLPNSSEVARLVSDSSAAVGEQATSTSFPTIMLHMSPAGFTFRVVCTSSSGIQNQYRFVSIVAYFTNITNGSGAGEEPQYGQFEFECTDSEWAARSNILNQTLYDRTTLASNSIAINASQRTDCSYCLNPVPSPPRFADTVNHCHPCSGCAQPLCYITDTSLPTSGSNFTSVCCNYYMSDGNCTTACPPSFYPDGNRTCVPCSLTCQNGGTLRSDSCACNCTAVSTGSDCSDLCPANCSNCSNPNICTTCNSGYNITTAGTCELQFTTESDMPASGEGCGGACIGGIIGGILGAILVVGIIVAGIADAYRYFVFIKPAASINAVPMASAGLSGTRAPNSCDVNTDAVILINNAVISSMNNDTIFQNNDAVISNNNAVISNNDDVISNNNAVISNNDTVNSNNITDNDAAISNNGAVISNNVTVISNNDAAISNNNAVISNNDAIISNSDAVSYLVIITPTPVLCTIAGLSTDSVISNEDALVTLQ